MHLKTKKLIYSWNFSKSTQNDCYLSFPNEEKKMLSKQKRMTFLALEKCDKSSGTNGMQFETKSLNCIHRMFLFSANEKKCSLKRATWFMIKCIWHTHVFALRKRENRANFNRKMKKIGTKRFSSVCTIKFKRKINTSC